MFENITQTVDNLLVSLLYLVLGFALFYIGKIVFQLVNKGIDVNHELVEKDNLAFALTNVGYYIGLLLAIGAAMSNEHFGTHIWHNLLDVAIMGGLAIILLNISAIINDKLILREFSARKEIIEDQNSGTGIIEAANYIATGLILNGVLKENSDAYYEVVILFLIAQIAMILVSLVYNAITPYDVHEHIEKDNVAVGIGFAGAMIAIANLIAYGVSLESNTWIEVGEILVLETGIGLLILPVVRFVTDKILLPGQNLTDEIVNQEKPNIGAAIIEAFAYIGGSALIIWSFS
jgi:uncharacterized membrane protein YjfL (UPF0719 family)